MKKINAFLVGAGLIASSVLAAEPVTSVNVVGYVNIQVPGTNTAIGKLTMVSVPFAAVGAGGLDSVYTLDEMVGSKSFIPAGTMSTADQVLMWSGTAYSTAFLCDGSWEAGGFVGTSNKWCYMAYDPVYDDIRPYPCAGTNIFNLWAGRGFWLRNRHSNTTLTISGEVPTISTNGVDVGSALSMVAYPYPSEAVIASIISTNDGAHASGTVSTADQIQTWNGSSYVTYFFCNDSWVAAGFPETAWKWCYMAFDAVYDDVRPYAATNAFLKPGDGFWYRSRGGAFTWPVEKPYTIGN